MKGGCGGGDHKVIPHPALAWKWTHDVTTRLGQEKVGKGAGEVGESVRDRVPCLQSLCVAVRVTCCPSSSYGSLFLFLVSQFVFPPIGSFGSCSEMSLETGSNTPFP